MDMNLLTLARPTRMLDLAMCLLKKHTVVPPGESGVRLCVDG